VQREADQSRIILDILESVHREGERSQRSRASEVGVALGLVNACLKFCIRKGYVKARKTAARGYQYMLTPRGLAEKSRLALTRLSASLDFIQAIRGEYAALFASEAVLGWKSVVIAGHSTLAEICAICAMERPIKIVAIVNPLAREQHMLGLPVHRDFTSIGEAFDGVIVADLQDTALTVTAAEAAIGRTRVAIPPILRASLPRKAAA
jgi:hypothetical protein